MAGLPRGFKRGLLFGTLFALTWGVLANRRRRGAIGGEVIDRMRAFPFLGSRVSVALGDQLMDGIYRAIAQDVVSRVTSGELLEFESGSGHVAAEIARRARDLQITAMDSSVGLVQAAEARIHASGLGVQAKVVHGEAIDIPFPDGSFDCVVSFRGFRRAGPPEKILGEIHRVLRPGGMAWLYDFRKETPEEAWNMVREKLPLLQRAIFDSVVMASWESAYNYAQIDLYGAESPFKNVAIEPLSADMAGMQIRALTKATFQK